MRIEPTDAELRAHYARTALARMGIPFERGMESKAVRIVVEGAVMAARRVGEVERVAA